MILFTLPCNLHPNFFKSKNKGNKNQQKMQDFLTKRHLRNEWVSLLFKFHFCLQLANSMLTLFDPTLEPELEPPQDLLKLIPMYRSPKIQGGILPGRYLITHTPHLLSHEQNLCFLPACFIPKMECLIKLCYLIFLLFTQITKKKKNMGENVSEVNQEGTTISSSSKIIGM